ncbi:MAG: hypothetical protein AAF821_23605 [Cyanobacteria bacterium P01_D01_bin.156]
MAAKSIRKSISFDDSDGDRALLDAIAIHQSEQQQTFSDLCKQALRQYLLNREASQPVMLFMELQHQLTQLNIRVAALERSTHSPATFEQKISEEPLASELTASEPEEQVLDIEEPNNDPVLSRLGPLLDDF